MSDRFIFRGKTAKGVSEWIVGDFVHNWKCSEYLIIADGVFRTVNPETVGQCIGLRDKSENLIFNGDVIKYYAKHLLVEEGDYNEIRLRPINKPFCDSFCCDMPSIIFSSDEIEVIGNIYENPELLETK